MDLSEAAEEITDQSDGEISRYKIWNSSPIEASASPLQQVNQQRENK